MSLADTPRILLVGGAASELCLAGGLARKLKADIRFARDGEAALADVRLYGCDLILVEVTHDVAAIVRLLRAENFGVPIVACGVGAPGELTVAAVRAGARDYVPLPPSRDLIEAVIAEDSNDCAGRSADVDRLVGHKMDEVERAMILETLQRCNGNRTVASQLLGISVRTMRNKLRAFIGEGLAVPPAA
ncbi:DNA-binding response regulator [Sphingomonas sp. KRR8]|uniref:DNA-binding response regulator n=1 Tax=Sphingomonas sp. KRR8 TaxID=2942996 RepID=UPI0020220D32|nr:DNA-binding response regulator [Sphingomonas sp. KRR8]URD61899.1 DNA-binding response regulator [Sphingomonas sp. KRR8]